MTRPVLVVDDEDLILTLMRSMLKNAGYAVETAASAQAALDMIAAGLRPSLVILDLRMPCMDGNALIQELQSGPAADVPKILLSACVGDLREDLRHHLTAVIERPVASCEIIRAVRAAIGDPCADGPG